MRRTRREYIRGGLLFGVGVAGCSGPQVVHDTATPSATTGGSIDALGLETVASGFTAPVAFADPPGGRRYVADQAGQIYALEDGSSDPMLDITDRMVSVSGYDERGLLGLAFHPAFPDTRLAYVRYSAPPRSGTPSEYSHTFVLSEFKVATDGSLDADSERTILELPEPQANHNAGAIAFGPDGYLYVTVGDGGGANDTGMGHVEDWYDGTGGGNGQDVTANLLGSILRIDVDATGGEKAYGIPEGNPLVGEEGLPEHYAWGLRNPWGMSFDGETLLVADVGQNRYEEVNVVEKGGNYGWNVREGRSCFQASECPRRDDRGQRFKEPVVAYSHAEPEPSGVAVVGGHRYRGGAIPGLQGAYVFGDWKAQGSLFVASPSDADAWPVRVVDVEPAADLPRLLAIGRDRAGELYALTTDGAIVAGSSGAVHRIVAR